MEAACQPVPYHRKGSHLAGVLERQDLGCKQRRSGDHKLLHSWMCAVWSLRLVDCHCCVLLSCLKSVTIDYVSDCVRIFRYAIDFRHASEVQVRKANAKEGRVKEGWIGSTRPSWACRYIPGHTQLRIPRKGALQKAKSLTCSPAIESMMKLHNLYFPSIRKWSTMRSSL